MSDQPILMALSRLETGQIALRDDLISRMHRFEERLDRLDQRLDPFEARLDKLDVGLTRIDAGQIKLRADLMARIDRLQHRMDNLDEHLTMGLGHSDRVEQRTKAVAEDNRLLGEQVMTLTKILRQLEARIRGLEDRE